ncbi:hypothetical protein [Pseudomonas sp. ESBL9]|uniref:hypothetical protein n=1 Tax=Pseudomonas sp. ESBL9 TaxID=3077327 RepID=UPI002FC64DC7
MRHTQLLFSKYLWLGVILLLLAIILNKYFGQIGFVLYVIIQLLQSVAVAIIVASIFTYTMGTAEFVDKIKDLLEDVVVSRRFLGNLSTKDKEEALHAILKASDEESNKYSNITRFYEHHVSNTLEVKNKSVRSNYTITARAFYDYEKKLVAVNGIYSYRLFPAASGYQPIQVGFDEGDINSRVEKVIVHKPDGQRKVFDAVELFPQENVGSHDRLGSIDTNEIGSGHDHLDIELHVREYGLDHWFMFTFKALQPTDGFRLNLTCINGLEVRKHCVFDSGNAYHVDTVGSHELNIACHQWIKEGVGVSVLISIPHKFDGKGTSKEEVISFEQTPPLRAVL